MLEHLAFERDEDDMKISARNQCNGRIVEIIPGATTTHIKRDVDGQQVTAAITNDSAHDMKLSVGMTAYAVIKANDVMIGVD